MAKLFFLLLSVVTLVGQSWAHGVVTIPSIRPLGNAALEACGSAVIAQLESNIFGPIEEAVEKIDNTTTDACDLFLCRGAKVADNTEVFSFASGSDVTFHVEFKVFHTGVANVSIIDLASQSIVGSPLINWPVYANASLTVLPANQTDFTVTIPDLGSQCSTIGSCAIQWWWFGTAVDQTYESCVDFTQ